MKFRIKIKDAGAEPDTAKWEDYDENIDDPHEWAKVIIDRFNNTLRPGEKPRELIEVQILDEESREKHDWSKTNLVTIIDDNGDVYDTMKCQHCGITGKRYGLGGREPQRDSKYRYKVYGRCDTAKKHLDNKMRKNNE